MRRTLHLTLGLLAIGLLACSCSGDELPPPPPARTAVAGPVQSTADTSDVSDVSDVSDSEPNGPTAPADNEPEETEAASPGPSEQSSPAAQPSQETSTVFQVESMEIGGQYAESISMPFSGVALYANGDSVSIEHTFPAVPGTYRVDVTGASSNNAVATAELLLGMRSVGDVSFRGRMSSTQSVEFSIRTTPATRTLTLSAINDNNTWDLFVDEIELTLISTDADATGQL